MGKLGFRRSKNRGEVGKEGADRAVLPLPQSSLAVSSSGTSPSLEDATQSAAGNPDSSEKVHDNPRADRKRSWVWEHFEEYTDTKVIKVKGKEDIIQEFRRAKCIYCPKGAVGDYACDSYKNGTQGMIRHINNSCKYYPGRRVVDKNQKLLVGDKSKGNSLKAVAYNPDEVMQACVETEINKLFIAREMQTGSETEKVLIDMAGHMSTKFLKYYGCFKDLNPLVFIGLVLDPRFKLLNITHLLKKEGYDNDIVEAKAKELRDVLMSLYEAYAPKDALVKKNEVLTSSSQSTVTSSDSRGRASILSDWRKVVSELDEQVVAHEVDKYLLDPLEYTNLGESDFPILLWWKLNGAKYPVLAAIAKDVMAVQVSTVASEAAFSTGGRVIDNFRSSLTPKSVEALICLQSWLRGNDISCIEDAPGIKETEFYEKCEKDHITSASSSVNSCPPPKAKGKESKDASDEVVEVIESESENSGSEDSETS